MNPKRYNISVEHRKSKNPIPTKRIQIDEADNGEWIKAEDFDVERRHKDSWFSCYETEARLRIECLKGIKKLQRQRSDLRIQLLQNKHAAENLVRLLTEPRIHVTPQNGFKTKEVTKEVCIFCEQENIAGTQCCADWNGDTYEMTMFEKL